MTDSGSELNMLICLSLSIYVDADVVIFPWSNEQYHIISELRFSISSETLLFIMSSHFFLLRVLNGVQVDFMVAKNPSQPPYIFFKHVNS